MEHEDAARSVFGRVLEAVRALLTVNAGGWRKECEQIQELFDRFGNRLPAPLSRRLTRLRWRLHDYR